jgi:hypothetical protein
MADTLAATLARAAVAADAFRAACNATPAAAAADPELAALTGPVLSAAAELADALDALAHATAVDAD